MKSVTSLVLTALLATSFQAFAQQAATTPQAKEAEPDLAVLRAMKSRLFVLRYRDSLQMQRSLSALGSGANGATMKWANENGLNTLAVRDFPENLAIIEEAIKRLDVPAANLPTPDVELHLDVLFASRNPGPDIGITEGLRDVIKALKGTLTYRSYTLGADFVQRARPRSDSSSGESIQITGAIDPAALGPEHSKDTTQMSVECGIYHGIALEGQENGPAILRMKSFRLSLREGNGSEKRTLAAIGTELSLKEGEKVVVGTSVVKDRGLIVVLSARRVN